MHEVEEALIDERTTLETHIYEDGYIRVALLDELGLEIASLDGKAREDGLGLLKVALQDHLIAQYHYN